VADFLRFSKRCLTQLSKNDMIEVENHKTGQAGVESTHPALTHAHCADSRA